MQNEWRGFQRGSWEEEINVRDFIQNNYTPYEGDASFLEGPTEATNKLWGKLQALQKEDMSPVEKKALYYGVNALLHTTDERS